MFKLFIHLLLLSISVVLAPTAHAARLALVVGNDNYTHVSKLQNARNDAKLMSATLKEAGFDVSYAENVDRNALWRVIETLGRRINKGDEVVFFFAGHGVQIGSNPVLLPTDIKAESDRQVERDGVPLFDVQDALKAAKVSLLIIDACRDNPFPKVGTRSVGASRGLTPPDAAEGQAIIMSAGRNQKALDTTPGVTANNGLFTHEFVKVIKENGLDVRTALVKIRDNVDDKARNAHHEQRPSVIDDLRGNFYFFAPVTIVVQAPPPPAPTPTPSAVALRPVTRVQAADEIEQQAWEDVQAMDSKAAYELYLVEYPTGRFAARAKIKLAAYRVATSAPVATSVSVQPTFQTAAQVAAQTPSTPNAPKPPLLPLQQVSVIQTTNSNSPALNDSFASPYAKAKALPANVNFKVYLNTLKELSVEQIQAVDTFQKTIFSWSYNNVIAASFDGKNGVYLRAGSRHQSPYLAKAIVEQRCQQGQLKSPCIVLLANGKFDKSAIEQVFDTHFGGVMSDPAGLVDAIVSALPHFPSEPSISTPFDPRVPTTGVTPSAQLPQPQVAPTAQPLVSVVPTYNTVFEKAKALPSNVSIKTYLNTLKDLTSEQIQAVDTFQKVISSWSYSSAIAASFDGGSDLYARSGWRYSSPFHAKTAVLQRCQEKPLVSPCTVIFEDGKFNKQAFEQVFDTHFKGRMSDPAGFVNNFISIMPRFLP